MQGDLLRVSNLTVTFRAEGSRLTAVDGVTLRVGEGETLGVVGESGCGKSVTALSIMRLIPHPQGRVSGSILFKGDEILSKTEGEMQRIRGNAISMVFQEPMTSLNPVFTVGDQIAEVYRLHQGMTPREAMDKACDMLRLVGIPSPERRIAEYPHQMSGGMRQRAMIAMALACNPELLIADEPTTALDVTIQAQILALLRGLQEKLGTAVIMITHDLGVVAGMCRRVVVMYAGQVVEEADTVSLFEEPAHPYTMGLLKSIPALARRKTRLHAIDGVVPDLRHLPPGCRFAPRCSYRTPRCEHEQPQLFAIPGNRLVRCWRHARDAEGAAT